MSKCYACGEPIRRGYPMVTNKGENVVVCERCKRLWKKFKSENQKVDAPQTNCESCKHNNLEWYSEKCDGCCAAHSNYEPQNERSIR